MASGIGSSSNPGSQDPYSILGLEPGASFEAVQQAKEKRLLEVGDDLQARARVEASYDAVLMSSLKERQLGKVSNAAVSASQREEVQVETAGRSGGSNALLTRLRSINSSSSNTKPGEFWPNLCLPEGQGLTVRLVLGGLALLLVIVAPVGSTELILSVSTIALFLSQIRRGRRPLAALGWSVLLLATGLILGGLLMQAMTALPSVTLPITGDQLEAVPTVLLLWGGALLLA